MKKRSCPRASEPKPAAATSAVRACLHGWSAALYACCCLAAPRVAHGQEASNAGVASLATSQVESFKTAVGLFKEAKFAEALPLFRDLAATTNSPNAQLYVGHCLVKMQRRAEAYRAFSRTLRLAFEQDSEKYAATREAANLELLQLGAQVARIVLSFNETPADLAVTVDGETVERAELGSPVVLEPGSHRVEVVAAGKQVAPRQLDLVAGETRTVTLQLVPSEPPPRPPVTQEKDPRGATDSRTTLRTLGFVAGGVGVVGLSVFAIAGLRAKSAHDRLTTECASGCADRQHADDIQNGKRLQTTANVGLIVAALGLAGGGTLVFLGTRPDEQRTAQLAIGQRGAMFSYAGAF
jgi:hypothetical protein